jgi:hypothetical protein
MASLGKRCCQATTWSMGAAPDWARAADVPLLLGIL